jgi:2-methylcitrate dehydratase
MKDAAACIAKRSASDPIDVVQRRIAEFSHDLRFEAIPPAAVHAAKALFIDTTGVLLAAVPFELCVKLRSLAPPAPLIGSATLLGASRRTTPEQAAFVNATVARYLEANDVFARYRPGTAHGHPSDVIMPLLAVAESTRADGRAFIEAVVMAYEIYLRICDACHSAGFDAATFGCIAVSAAASKLLGLSSEQIGHAVAIAATGHNILKQVRSDHVTVWKALAAGEGGRAGVHAAFLAAAGIEGPSRPFLGSNAWCEHVAGTRFELREMGAENAPFLICESRIKTRPARALTISPILAAEKLASSLGDPGAITRIVVATYKRAWEGTKAEHWVAANRETADHSVPYCVAAALLDGTLTPSSFDARHLDDPRLRALMAKMEVVEDAAYTRAYIGQPQQHRTRVSIETKSGQRIEAESGGDEDDLASAKSDRWIERKFHQMTENVAGSDRAASLLQTMWKLDECADVGFIVTGMAVVDD